MKDVDIVVLPGMKKHRPHTHTHTTHIEGREAAKKKIQTQIRENYNHNLLCWREHCDWENWGEILIIHFSVQSQNDRNHKTTTYSAKLFTFKPFQIPSILNYFFCCCCCLWHCHAECVWNIFHCNSLRVLSATGYRCRRCVVRRRHSTKSHITDERTLNFNKHFWQFI